MRLFGPAPPPLFDFRNEWNIGGVDYTKLVANPVHRRAIARFCYWSNDPDKYFSYMTLVAITSAGTAFLQVPRIDAFYQVCVSNHAEFQGNWIGTNAVQAAARTVRDFYQAGHPSRLGNLQFQATLDPALATLRTHAAGELIAKIPTAIGANDRFLTVYSPRWSMFAWTQNGRDCKHADMASWNAVAAPGPLRQLRDLINAGFPMSAIGCGVSGVC